MNIHSNASLRGEYKFIVLGADRKVKRETPWMPNLITDIGLDRIGVGSAIGTSCRIGTGTTTPANSDTDLVAPVASTSTQTGSPSTVNNGTPNYETAYATTYEFALGAVVGNMAEVGVGWATSGATLFSRALIVNGGGTPTTISVLITEILQVVYRLTIYPNLSDATDSVTISGVSYAYTARYFNAGTALFVTLTSGILTSVSAAVATTASLTAYTTAPTGTQATLTAGALAAYSSGNYYRDYTISAALAVGNLAGGIKTLLMTLGTGGNTTFRTQIEFTPAIPKDNTKVFSLTLRQSWSRH